MSSDEDSSVAGGQRVASTDHSEARQTILGTEEFDIAADPRQLCQPLLPSAGESGESRGRIPDRLPTTWRLPHLVPSLDDKR